MTPLLFGITGLISTAKKHFTNPLAEARDWSDYESPAIERRGGVDLDHWRDANLVVDKSLSPRRRGSLDQFI